MKSLKEAVSEYLLELRARSGGEDLSRVEGFFDNLLAAEPSSAEDARQRDGVASRLWVPGLRAQPWHDPAELPWLSEVAAARAGLLEEGGALFKQGLLAPSHEGRSDLDYRGWIAFDLMTIDLEVAPDRFDCKVVAFPENRARAPVAAGLVDRLPLLGDCFYSVLEPGGVVKPHFSQFNAKLICHYGLSVPQDCGIRVAGETRGWEDGKFLLFDDTYWHDTWNRSSDPRLLFHMNVWHPDLTRLEVSALSGWLARRSVR